MESARRGARGVGSYPPRALAGRRVVRLVEQSSGIGGRRVDACGRQGFSRRCRIGSTVRFFENRVKARARQPLGAAPSRRRPLGLVRELGRSSNGLRSVGGEACAAVSWKGRGVRQLRTGVNLGAHVGLQQTFFLVDLQSNQSCVPCRGNRSATSGVCLPAEPAPPLSQSCLFTLSDQSPNDLIDAQEVLPVPLQVLHLPLAHRSKP